MLFSNGGENSFSKFQNLPQAANMKPRTPARKYHFMLGTTSRVPGSRLHYLILDVDNKKPCKVCELLPFQLHKVQFTKSGFHVYTDLKLTLTDMLTLALDLGADRTWARLALKRGWAFLADKGEVKIPWPVERMCIGWRPFSKTDQSRLEFLNDKSLDNARPKRHHRSSK